MRPHLCAVLPFILACASPAAERQQREESFAFAQKPMLLREGDRVTISFETTAFCDVTVVIEAPDGRIVRHLAAGVLGSNPPAPFAQNEKKQALVWDGKDDRGKYLDDAENLSVRVSLGLQPVFERNLHYSPYKRVSGMHTPLIAAAKEGVLVYEGEVLDTLRLYGHDGTYRRTVYPFPAEQLDKVNGLHWAEWPQDGKRLPMREGHHQSTLLTSGRNAGFGDFGTDKHNNWDATGATGNAASAMAFSGEGRIALANLRLNRLHLDGHSGGSELTGPGVCYRVRRRGKRTQDEVDVGPTSAAFSPDGKYVYLTGYFWDEDYGTGGVGMDWLPAVTRVEFEGGQEAQVFAGSVDRAQAGRCGLKVPTSVACDAKGRVYVSDYAENRVLVFDAQGKQTGAIACDAPAQLAIDPVHDELYVFSWPLLHTFLDRKHATRNKPAVTRFGPLVKPGRIASFELPLEERGTHRAGDRFGMDAGLFFGLNYRATVDPWGDVPTIWLVPGRPDRGPLWEKAGIRLFRMEGKKLELLRDFGVEAAKELKALFRPVFYAQRLFVNPADGMLYVGEANAAVGKAFGTMLRIDPGTGKSANVELPFDTEDLAFDLNGLACLRARQAIVRFDPATWREVPFDYGEEFDEVNFASSQVEGWGMRRYGPVLGGIKIPLWRYNQQGGVSVNASGEIAAAFRITKPPEKKTTFDVVHANEESGEELTIFPGRALAGAIKIFDPKGKTVSRDALPGIGIVHGLKMDREGNLYMMAAATRIQDGKRYFNGATDTLMKFRKGEGRILNGDFQNEKGRVPVPLNEQTAPKRSPDVHFANMRGCWVEGADWMVGGVGFNGRNREAPGVGCDCWSARFDLDLLARSFVPEVDRCSVLVLDSHGNQIVRVGSMGNMEDAGLHFFYAPYVAVHTDRRLFVSDPGNNRIVAAKLDYHASAVLPIKAARQLAGSER